MLIIVCMVTLSTDVFSQDPYCPPGNPAGDPNCLDSDPSIPFDGGASLLLAAGAGLLGIKAFRKKTREANS
ncbi:MAG: hypothetical protein H7259_08360 [Cytophagales bacterium]|nr:hypothetical protein [Cytophaga sp.]